MEVLIKQRRKERKMSQQELAALIGVSQSTLSRIETGELRVTLAFLSEVATALDLTIEALYQDKDHAHA